MQKIETPLSGVYVIEPQVFHDERGYFFEAYHEQKLAELGISDRFLQMNQSFSRQGVLRGMHFQKAPHAQSKLVRCLRGRIFDVVVDLRHGSSTFGKWHGVELSSERHNMLYVPVGFAHGFYAMTDAEIMYLCGHANYDKPSEGGMRWDDPGVGINWPLLGTPTVHPRDAAFPLIHEMEVIF